MSVSLAPSRPAPGSATTTAEPSRPRRPPTLILLVLALSTFAVTVMQSMVMPVLSDLAASLQISMTTATWILTVSQLSAAVFTPLLGSLGDSWGRKRVLLVTLGLVTLGSVLVAVSGSLFLVLAGRVLQGMGFAAMPLAIGIVRSILPSDRVPSSIAVLSAITGVGAGAGLLIAGLLAKAGLSGQTMFWIAGAVTLVGLIGAAVLIDLPEKARRVHIDLGGLLTLSGGLVCLLLGINRGSAWGWTSGGVLGLFAGAVVLLVAWVVVEQHVANPLVDIAMMKRPVVLGTNITAFLTGAGMFGAFVLVIQFVQTPSRFGYGFDGDALISGLTLLPMTAGTLLASGAVSAMIRRWGPKVPLVVGTVIATLTFGFLLLAHTEHWEFFVATGILGLGLGMGMGAMPTLLNSAVSPEQTSIANSVNQTLRSVGGSIGTTLATAVLGAITIAGTSLPAVTAYTTAFWISGGICLIAIAAALAVPYRHAAGLATTAAAELSGTVRGPDGGPLARAAVTVTGADGQELGHTSTGLDGRYRLPAPAGPALMLVAAPGWQPAVCGLTIEGPTVHDIVLDASARIDGTLRRQDLTGPAAGATLTLTDPTGRVVAAGHSDERGRFRLQGLASGPGTLTAVLPGTDAAPSSRSVLLEAGDVAEVRMMLGASSSGPGRHAAPRGPAEH